MAERKIQVQTPEGVMADGMDVPIERSDERWSEFTLRMGLSSGAKINIASAVRGRWAVRYARTNRCIS